MNKYEELPRVVFDCMVYLQATLNPNGVSARLLDLLEKESYILFVSEPILDEAQNVLNRPKIREKNALMTDADIERLFGKLEKEAVFVFNVPEEFKYERDPKDEKYINLALVTRARYLVTFDTDLLDLMNEEKEAGRNFRLKYPFLQILTPIAFLSLLEKPNGN